MIRHWTTILVASLMLAACNGGGDSTATDPVGQALTTGNSNTLSAEAMPALLQSATQTTQQTHTTQRSLLASMLDDSTVAPLDFTTNSQSIRPILSTAASPLLVSNNGNILASFSQAHGGRALGYGKDLLAQLSTASGSNQAQLPLFTRSFTWLVTGQAAGPLPAKVRVATQNYTYSTVANLVTRLGATAEQVTCNLTIDNTCWQNADILVFGPGTPGSASLADRVAGYLKAGKGVIYLHNSWTDSTGGRQVLQAMGMKLGDYPGNYFASADGVQIGNTRTAEQLRQAADQMGTVETALNQLASGANVDFATDTTLIAGLDSIRRDLAALESRGIDLFADDYPEKPYMALHRRLVLWADLYRQQVDYATVKRSDAVTFFKTLAADTLTYAVRPAAPAPRTFGDWMPVAAKNLQPSSDWETLEVTIAQTSGRTAIGRGAIPGKSLTVEVLDAAGANLGLRIGNIRTRGNPQAQENYTRPRYPDGHQSALSTAKTLTYTTPWGGPLFLAYDGATAGGVVKLRVRGAVKYAHFDFTQNPSQAEIDEAVAALNRADFGWQTAKFTGGEVQQTIGYAKQVIGTKDPKNYVVDRLKGLLFDSNHIANGYNNIAPTSNVAALCQSLSWDCTGPVHRAPGVQHFVGWLAACGFLCSGNPSDGYAGLAPGWGWWHELGHNTVPRSQHLVFKDAQGNDKGCVVECDNNILANASAMRMYAVTGGQEDVNGDRIDHKGLYQALVDAAATGKTGDDLRLETFNQFWLGSAQNHNAMRAVHFQLAFMYTRLRLNQPKPLPLDTIDFLGLLSRGNRLVDQNWTQADWDNKKSSLGMGRYTVDSRKSISNADLVYVLSSRLIGQDMRKLFALYGIALSADALGSIADLNLPLADKQFYALASGKGNQTTTGQWLNLESGMPAYPFN